RKWTKKAFIDAAGARCQPCFGEPGGPEEFLPALSILHSAPPPSLPIVWPERRRIISGKILWFDGFQRVDKVATLLKNASIFERGCSPPQRTRKARTFAG